MSAVVIPITNEELRMTNAATRVGLTVRVTNDESNRNLILIVGNRYQYPRPHGLNEQSIFAFVTLNS